MRRALIGGGGAVVSHLTTNGGYSDVLAWDDLDRVCLRFDEVTLLSLDSRTMAHPVERMDTLRKLSAKRATLVSTLDVFPNQSLPLDEDVCMTGWPNTLFGRRQLALERWALDHFSRTFIVRAPLLYGPGIEDDRYKALFSPAGVAALNPVAILQWYPISRLQSDLVIARHNGLRVVNLATEPVSNARIASRLFPAAVTGPASSPAPYSRIATKHAALFGGANGYIMRAEQILENMRLLAALCVKPKTAYKASA
jgi:nucleoside-diphosphate-sugar epimerase